MVQITTTTIEVEKPKAIFVTRAVQARQIYYSLPSFKICSFCVHFSVLNDLNSRYHQCLQKASELKQLVEPGLQSLDGKAMTVSSFTNKIDALLKQLFREWLSEKVHAIIPKGIVGGFEFSVLHRNLK